MSVKTTQDIDAASRYHGHNLRDHVRKRPDMYLGPIVRAVHEGIRVYDAESGFMRLETLEYSRALVQIVQELLTNAGDQEFKDNTMRTIRVTVPDCGESAEQPIVVENDGRGIPVLQKEISNQEPRDAIDEPQTKKAKQTGLVWIPTMCFAQERAGDNFDDDEVRWTGGRNGFGSKLSNVLSSRFTVEVKDPVRHKQFSQTWEDGMARATKPSIRQHKAKSGMVRVSMVPDYALFGYEGGVLDEPTRRIIITRVFDLAACTGKGVRVLLNGKPVGIKSFEDYGNLVFGRDKKARPRIYYQHTVAYDRRTPQYDKDTGDRLDDLVERTEAPRLELLIAAVDTNHHQQQQQKDEGDQITSIGFVNGLPCNRGTHMDYLLTRIVSMALDHFRKNKTRSKKDAVMNAEDGRDFCDYDAIKPQMVKNHVCIVAKVLVDNPEFDSQTKETLTRLVSKWGFAPKFDIAKIATDLQKTGALRLAMEDAMLAQQRTLSRQMTKQGSAATSAGRGLASRPNIAKYDHANKAGHKNAQCVLILTEGDSAKQLAVAGKRVVGSDYFGIFPLRGKLKNVSEMDMSDVLDSKEIKALASILGGYGPRITSTAQLRYQQVWLFTDADPDGAHIAMLVINALKQMLPNVAGDPTFIVRFATPIRAASLQGHYKRRRDLQDNLFFLTVPEFNEWLDTGRIPVVNQVETYDDEDDRVWANEALEPDYDPLSSREERLRAYSVDYLKGLGSSSNKMALRYFESVRRYVVKLDCSGAQSDEMLQMLFRKERKADRKRWYATAYDPSAYVDYNRDTVPLVEFVNGEYAHYARVACDRAIPRMVDGLKPSTAKILYAMMQRGAGARYKMKVSELAGYVSNRAGYHHGDQALMSALVGMAQNHLGTNNINYLYPVGQFGSRLDKPSMHAAPRYIYSYLDPIARALFRPEDDPVLLPQFDEGKFIEPVSYAPIVPTLLVNGVRAGIGFGFASFVPAYNPRDVAKKTRQVMRTYCRWVEECMGTLANDDDDDDDGGQQRCFTIGRAGVLNKETQWDEQRTRRDTVTGALVACDPPVNPDLPRIHWNDERAFFEATVSLPPETWVVCQNGAVKKTFFDTKPIAAVEATVATATEDEAEAAMREETAARKETRSAKERAFAFAEEVHSDGAPCFVAEVGAPYPPKEAERDDDSEKQQQPMELDDVEEGEEEEEKPWYHDTLVPWYDQFQGTIEPDRQRPGTYVVVGRFERLSDGERVRVTELPVGTWKDVWIHSMRERCRYYPAGATAPAGHKRKRAAKKKDTNDDGNGTDADTDTDTESESTCSAPSTPRKDKTKASVAAGKLRKAVGFYLSDEDNSTDLVVDVTIRCNAEQLAAMSDKELVDALKLRTTVSTRNLTLYDRQGRLKRYRTVNDIFYDFVVMRHYVYELRKDYELASLRHVHQRLLNQQRFVELVMTGQLVLAMKDDEQLVSELREHKFEHIRDRFQWVHPDVGDQERALAIGNDDDDDDDDREVQCEEDGQDDADRERDLHGESGTKRGSRKHEYHGYSYLLRMPLSSLTRRKWEQLCHEADTAARKVEVLLTTSIETMWTRDLDAFEQAYEKFLQRKSECLAQNTTVKKKKRGKRKRK